MDKVPAVEHVKEKEYPQLIRFKVEHFAEKTVRIQFHVLEPVIGRVNDSPVPIDFESIHEGNERIPFVHQLFYLHQPKVKQIGPLGSHFFYLVGLQKEKHHKQCKESSNHDISVYPVIKPDSLVQPADAPVLRFPCQVSPHCSDTPLFTFSSLAVITI
jgi:hypothetical protein